MDTIKLHARDRAFFALSIKRGELIRKFAYSLEVMEVEDDLVELLEEAFTDQLEEVIEAAITFAEVKLD